MPDENPHAPADPSRRRYRLTPDRVLLGPPVGGALCFAYQAVSVSRDPSGAQDLLSLFTALVIGTAAGAVVEGLIRTAFPKKADSHQPEGRRQRALPPDDRERPG